MRTIPLNGKKAAGRVALVDDEDYDLVMTHKWHVSQATRPGRDGGPYAETCLRGTASSSIQMHQLIMDCKRVDHVNHDGLDNQRANLRPATPGQNAANQRPYVGSSSKFKGVCWDRGERSWRAQIKVDGRNRYLGLFAAEKDAARAYDAAALAAWGEYAYLNFSTSAAVPVAG